MGSRKTHDGAEKVYAAAQKWVDCALRADDSLFTPGKAIWSSHWLGELREWLGKPVEEWRGYHEMFQRQLAGSPPEVCQLMGEALYFHFLIMHRTDMRGDTKYNRLKRVLGWSERQIEIPADLVDGLTPGIAASKAASAKLKWALPVHVGFLVKFVEQWKGLDSGERQRLLEDPWAFKAFATQGNEYLERLNASMIDFEQREALLHFVFPDYFDSIVTFRHKELIAGAEAFARFVTQPTPDVDRKIYQIRRGLEAELEHDFDFYDIRSQWDPKLGGLSEEDTSSETDGPEVPYPDLQALAEELFLPAKFLREIKTLLYEKRQVIFQGPPGTGKTYVAQELAECLAGLKEWVTLVQLHPSYAYEDFVQGYRPTLKDGQPGFELRNGPLLRAAKRAQDEPDADHFLVIDEINRGNLAKVFGELYFLLEYRDREMRLQYSDEPFSLPKNLYVIGTMNTADRSIALVDLALRRRFYFVEFHPDDKPIKGVLRRWIQAKAPGMDWVAGVVEQANKQLKGDRHAAIGPSYFMKAGLDDEAVDRIWKHSVLPYVEERLFVEREGLDEFALDKLRGAGTPDPQAGDGAEAQSGAENQGGGAP